MEHARPLAHSARLLCAVQRDSLCPSAADPTSTCNSESAGRRPNVDLMDRTVKNLCPLQVYCEVSGSMHQFANRRRRAEVRRERGPAPTGQPGDFAVRARAQWAGAVGCQSVVRPALRRSRWRSRPAGVPAQGMVKGTGRQPRWGGRPGPVVGLLGRQVMRVLAADSSGPTRVPAGRHVTCEGCRPAGWSVSGELLEGGLAYLQQS